MSSISSLSYQEVEIWIKFTVIDARKCRRISYLRIWSIQILTPLTESWHTISKVVPSHFTFTDEWVSRCSSRYPAAGCLIWYQCSHFPKLKNDSSHCAELIKIVFMQTNMMPDIAVGLLPVCAVINYSPLVGELNLMMTKETTKLL